jgi:hypothetical protein
MPPARRVHRGLAITGLWLAPAGLASPRRVDRTTPASQDGRPRTPLLPDGDAWVRARYVGPKQFAKLSKVSTAVLERRRDAGSYPEPPFVTEDLREWYPPNLAAWVRTAQARGIELQTLFLEEAHRMLNRARQRDAELHSALLRRDSGPRMKEEELLRHLWGEFQIGAFGAHPDSPWIPQIERQATLRRNIDALSLRPRPDHPRWRVRLLQSVEEWERLEEETVRWETHRFGVPRATPMRMETIRRAFPAVFRARPDLGRRKIRS